MTTQEIIDTKKLNKGWTTGACATACATACVYGFINGEKVEKITIDLPAGSQEFEIINFELFDDYALCSTIKDAGDDPDITHGCELSVKVSKNDNGIKYVAGTGVGTITKNGLPLPKGEPAINPKPREMIEKNIVAISGHNNWTVEVSIKNGEELAQKTWNPRLGIIGGLSVLGTTGVVIPYSCSAWIHSIHRGIDVAMADGINHIVGATGKTSEKVAIDTLKFDPQAYIDMGDFAGGMLKYASNNNVNEITICGGFAKLVKLAQGNRDLHSARSQVDFEKLASTVAELGGNKDDIEFTKSANTALEVLQKIDLDLAGWVAKTASMVAKEISKDKIKINIIIISRDGEILSHYKG
ncbi:MAG: cobalt-precorrin-5B (C(1))-methyltransferase [Alphaproteobacteria bacterium]